MTTIAIDFGTSNTVVSLLEPDTQTPKTLRFPAISRVFRLTRAQGEVLEMPVVPTLAFIKPQNQLVLGQQVRSQRLGLSQPDRLFKAFKRDLVADFQPPSRQIDGQSYSAATIAEQFLQQLWQRILAEQIQPSQVIFTVPVGAFERYLDWFRGVADKLEIPQMQLVDEPTAAALGYAVQRPGAIVLVVDFGGGTLDLSLVRTETSSANAQVRQAEVLAKSDAYVGGEDVDIWIAEDYLQQKGMNREAVGQVGWQNLLELAERLKIRLSSHEEAAESWLDEETFTAYDLKLTRSHLETILENRQFLEQLRQAVDEVLTIALSKGISKSDIEQVLLVGGSCLIPAVQQLILSYFGRQRVKLDRPFEAVAHGALVVTQLSSIGDYLRHSYAIRTWEPYAQMDTYIPLFERGTKYPCQRSQPLILRVANEGQKEIRLDIGEVAEIAQAEVAYDAKGRMTITGLQRSQAYRSLETNGNQVCVAHLTPPGQTGVDRISVEFEVNEQRTLIATVRDLFTDQILVEKGAIAKLE
jgi:molecular chaperone DnaK (HSP70)